jgi:phosphatidylinositol alpha-1,6-mannosyltransferase
VWFGGFTSYAWLVAIFTGHEDRAWAVWGFGAYALATIFLWFGRTWVVPLVVAVAGAVVAPTIWLVTQTPATAEVAVICRAASHLLKYGTPYLPPSQLSDWQAYNPYLPVMELFGLPRGAGLTGVLGDPRIWMTLLTVASLAATFAIMQPHDIRGCNGCRGHVAKLTAIAVASPVIALPLALGITDPPVIVLLCLTLACVSRGKWVSAGLALAIACAMKSTAWPALPVLAIMALAQHARRAAARFTVTAIGATALLALLAAPDAMAQPAAIVQNTVEFPLGMTKHKTPAASPLPGHLLSTFGESGHWAAVGLMLVAGLAFAAWVILRPPRTARSVAWRLAVGYAVIFVLAPATRFGYFAYPLGLLGWMAFASFSTERAELTPPAPRSPVLVP